MLDRNVHSKALENVEKRLISLDLCVAKRELPCLVAMLRNIEQTIDDYIDNI